MRNNIILQYTLVTALFSLIVAVSLGFVLSQRAVGHLVATHGSIYPDLLRIVVDRHPEFHEFLEAPPGTPIPQEVGAILQDLLSVGAISQIKVRSSEGTVLWSNDAERVGGHFAEHPQFLAALGGDPAWSFAEPKGEAAEVKGGRRLEVFTPIMRGGDCLGVVEIYESDRSLAPLIAGNKRIVWGSVGTSGAALYALLFIVFYRAHRKQKTTNEQLIETQNVTLFALAYSAEMHDLETGNHLERTAQYVRILAEELRKIPRYQSYMTDRYVEDLVRSTPLHDIGKVGVPDAILRKPGGLSEEEFELMKRHPEFGATILRRAEEKLTFESFLTIAIQITLHHHEKWDGTGYPVGLKGAQIPLSARIMALADVYDALRSRRYYKEPLPHSECIGLIRAKSGCHFDPEVVEAFLRQERSFRQVSEDLCDDGDLQPARRAPTSPQGGVRFRTPVLWPISRSPQRAADASPQPESVRISVSVSSSGG